MGKIVLAALAGAIAIGAAGTAAAATTHAAWCAGTYRSYNPATDTFVGFDGNLHRCVSPSPVGATAIFGLGVPGGAAVPARPAANGGGSGHGYNVFPSESDPNYGTPLDPDSPQSG